MCRVAPLYVKDSWLRRFQTCLEVHLEQCGSQLPSPLYFPSGPGMDCFNRFTTSSGSRCYCCDYVLSQGSHSLCVNVLWLLIHLAKEKRNPAYGLNLPIMWPKKSSSIDFYLAFPIHPILKAVCQMETFGEGPTSCLPNPTPVLVTSCRMCIHFPMVKVTHCKNVPSKQSFICFP